MANIVRINGKAVKDLAAAADIAVINAEIGNLADLDTTDKSSLVAAINEAAQSGGGGGGAVDDVKVNGNTVVTDGVANVPLADTINPGVVKMPTGTSASIFIDGNGTIHVSPASANTIKSGTSSMPISAGSTDAAAFYGLARAAGDTTQKQSSNPVGTYTSGAKQAIKTMLGINDITSYNALNNKPSINGVTLSGNSTLPNLGIASAADLATKYTKPSDGIPKSDLASAVQTSLGKADTALQTAPVASVAGKTGAVTLDAGDVEYDDTDTYAAGSVGAGFADLKSEIEELPDVSDTVQSGADLYICDASGNVIGMFANGHFKTKYFNSADLATSGILYRNRDTIDGVYAACRWHQPTSSDKQFCMLISGDIHTDPTRMLNIIEYLNAIDAFDAGVMLGDMSGDTFADSISHYSSALVNTQKPFLTVLGNHDVVGATSEYALYTKYGGMLQYAELASGESVSEKCYYYKDFVAQKIRVIVLMQYDLVGRASDTGDICFGQDQINWFIGVLGSTPSDYGVIIAEHTNPSRYMTYNMDEEYTSSTWYQSNYAPTVMDGNPIPDIVNAWINGTTLSQTYSYTFDNPPTPLSVSADFTSRGTGEFITYIGGHWHMDVLGTPTGYTDQPDYHVPAAGLSAATQGDIPRKTGTVSEDSFCVMAVDRNKKTVKIFHIGAHRTKDAVDRQYFKYNYGGANA